MKTSNLLEESLTHNAIKKAMKEFSKKGGKITVLPAQKLVFHNEVHLDDSYSAYESWDDLVPDVL